MIPPDFFNNNYLFAEKARLRQFVLRHCGEADKTKQ